VFNLLLVHVARADGTDQQIAAAPAEREDNEDRPSLRGAADGPKAPLVLRMRIVAQDR
jgi:hypothetical protein